MYWSHESLIKQTHTAWILCDRDGNAIALRPGGPPSVSNYAFRFRKAFLL